MILASTLKRAPWVTALKPLGDKGRKGFPPSSVQDIMHVGYQSNHGTHPTSSLHSYYCYPADFPDVPRSRSDRWLKRSDCVPQGAACGCHMGVITPVGPPPAERTHLFGSLMSNTDVTVTRTLMMSTAGSRTMRPPKSPDLRPRRRVLAYCLPRLLTLFLRANVFREQLLPLHISCIPTFCHDIKFHLQKHNVEKDV